MARLQEADQETKPGEMLARARDQDRLPPEQIVARSCNKTLIFGVCISRGFLWAPSMGPYFLQSSLNYGPPF